MSCLCTIWKNSAASCSFFSNGINRAVILSILLITCAGLAGAADGVPGQKIYPLDECVAQALSAHPKVSIYEHKADQKKEKLNAVTAENLPQVDAVASYDRLSYVSQAKQRYLGGSNNDYQADIVVTQPLYAGGKIASQKSFARYAIDAAELGYLAARDDVIFGVKSAYYKLIFARDILRSKEVLLKYTQTSYDTALDLNKRTKTPREEVLLRLEVQINEARQELISARESLKIEQKALLNAMGLDSSGSIDVQDLKEDFFLSEDIPFDVADNYEILKLSKEAKEADEQINIAKSGFYPRLDARYSYGYEWGDWSQGGDTDWIAGVAVDFNIWDWGKTRADIKQAKAYKEEVQSYENLLRQQIGLELESARLKYESASKRFEIAKTSYDQAKRSLDLFESRYQGALVTSVELLDAQRAFALAQVRYFLSILDMRLAKAEIEKISGQYNDGK